MVEEYTRTLYDPAARRFHEMTAAGLARAADLCAWRGKVAAAWPSVRIEKVTDHAPRPIRTGNDLAVAAEIHLGALSPDEVEVDVYYGLLRGAEAIAEGVASPLRHAGDLGGGRHRFEGVIPARESGEHAFAVRVIPRHDALPNRFATRLCAWQ
jgi:starch phosphorylase